MNTSQKSVALGLLGVVLFALTLPMTRLAVGSAAAPALSPWFVAFGRAALAGVLSIAYLALFVPRQSGWWPDKADLPALSLAALANVLGWPILLGIALLYVESVHAAVITGILPLATAVLTAFTFGLRPSRSFWVLAAVGAGLVVVYAALRGQQTGASVALHWADVLLCLAVFCAAAGYAVGGRLSQKWPGERVICWMLIMLLPVNAVGALLNWPSQPIDWTHWLGFLYVSIFSMWLGMFVWFRALAMGHAVHVSQLQLIQPFLTIVFSIPLLGEKADAMTWGFGLAVVVVVYWGKRLSGVRRSRSTTTESTG